MLDLTLTIVLVLAIILLVFSLVMFAVALPSIYKVLRNLWRDTDD